MNGNFLIESVSFVLLTREVDGTQYVLLQERCNTGVFDNMYDVSCSGHLEWGESCQDAAVREAKEELGIVLKKENLNFVAALNIKCNEGRQFISMAFQTDVFLGEPHIVECNKCRNLKWFSIDKLPSNLSGPAKEIIASYFNGNHYVESGY